MSLYYVQKLLYDLNRDSSVQERYAADRANLFNDYTLTVEEKNWLDRGDVGELYIHGVNGQILMHFAAHIGLEWDEYIQAMKDGLKKHGQVRDGIYATVDGGKGGAV